MTTSSSRSGQPLQSVQAPPGKRMMLPPPPQAFVGQWCRSRGRKRVIVALDMGTSTSRFSVLVLPRHYDGSQEGQVRHSSMEEIPTVVFQKTVSDVEYAFGREALERFEDEADDDDDNDDYDAGNKTLALYRNFKTALHAPHFTDSHDVNEMTVTSTTGDTTHNLLDLMGRYLHFLCQLALSEVRTATLQEDDESFRADVPHDDDEIQWVLTVPCVWDDLAKSFLRRAACRAGLIREETSDRLLLAVDSEAASLAAFGEGARLGLFGTGASFLLVDCGGGTVDMASHTVGTSDQDDDFLVLDTTTAPRGGPWGSHSIDEEFSDFLRYLLGCRTWELLVSSCPGEVERVLQDFAILKSGFDPDHCEDGLRISLGFLLRRRPTTADEDLPDLTALVKEFNSQSLRRPLFDLESKVLERNLRKSVLVFTREQVMAYFFKPTLDRICSAFENYLIETEAGTIVLVGDYGSSKAVGSRLRSLSGGAHVIVPERPQTAVLRGASYFALAPNVLGSRILPCTYGLSSQREWTEGCGFDRNDAEMDATTGKLMVDGVFSTLVRAGTSVPHHRVFKSPVYRGPQTVHLYKSTESCPRRVTDGGCKCVGTIQLPPSDASTTVRLQFSFGTEISVRLMRDDDEEGMLIRIRMTGEAPDIAREIPRPVPPRRTRCEEGGGNGVGNSYGNEEKTEEEEEEEEEEGSTRSEEQEITVPPAVNPNAGPPTPLFVPPPPLNPNYVSQSKANDATQNKKDDKEKLGYLNEEEEFQEEESLKEEMKKPARRRSHHHCYYDSQSPPHEFFCKLTLEFMDDPVIATDGETYEREALEKWFAEFPRGEKPRSPATGLLLESRSLIPNRAIKKQIQDYVALYGRPKS